MNKIEPKNILDLPIVELAKLCVDPAILLLALTLAYKQGIKAGQENSHRFYHMMFAGQDETSIKN